MRTFTALSLGGNIGDVEAAFEKAIGGLAEAGLEDIKRSSIKVYPPVDCHPGTPDFLNMALTGFWNGSAERLRAVCAGLEERAGRPLEHDSAASRTLDIDIIAFGSEPMETSDLTIPHPRALERLFVLEPLAEIAGDLTFPGTLVKINEALLGLYARKKGRSSRGETR